MDVIELIKKECLRRRYSRRTIETYCYCIKKFLRRTHVEIKKITKRDVQDYLDLYVERNSPGNTINVNLNALKFLFEQILRKRLLVRIRYAKVSKKLPEVLTKEEVFMLINAIDNKKHKLMISLMYSAGLRVSELAMLKMRDLQLDKNYGWVREGKGGKDRLFIIADSLKGDLYKWILTQGLSFDSWLFRGSKNKYDIPHISPRTLQVIVKNAAKKSGISKNVHPHTLRHSFATHLIEDGHSVTDVQPLLGHSSIGATMIYLHTASSRMLSIKSPYDTLDIIDKNVDLNCVKTN